MLTNYHYSIKMKLGFKKNGDFVVTMGSCIKAKVCELVGLYFPDILRKEFGDNNIALYGDDGLRCSGNLSGPLLEKMKKNCARSSNNMS